MQQQQQQMMNIVSSIPPSHVTTEQIQQCLDENKQLIMLIMENQNVGKFAECAPYQAQLQKNLMNLAKIADAQPSGGGGGGGGAAATSYAMSGQPAMQQGHFMPMSGAQAQAQAQQQQSPYTSKLPFQLTTEQQMQMQAASNYQQQQFMQGQVGMRPNASPNSGIYHARNLMDMHRGGGKQDGSDAATRD